MPSPLAHITIGYIVYRVFRAQTAKPAHDGVLLATVGFSLLPDVDSALGLVTGDFGRFHNNITHSLLVGAAVAAAVAGVIWWRQRNGFWRWFALVLMAYDLHILMDFLTIGRGVMALWPVTEMRFRSPMPLFYGLHWSQGWLSVRHLWTLITELGFAAVALLGLYAYNVRVLRHRLSDGS